MSVPIIDTPRRPSALQQLLGGASEGLQDLVSKRRNERALKGLESLFEQVGIGPEQFQVLQKSGLSPDQALNAFKTMASVEGKRKQESGLSNEEYANILDQMDSMLESGEAGQLAYAKSFLPGFLGGGSARETTARFQSLGTSLLGLAQQIALKSGIRNQKEFDLFVDRTVPNQNDDADTARGKINALRSYVKTGKLPASASSESPKMKSRRARNPKTGEVIEWTGSEWRKVK